MAAFPPTTIGPAGTAQGKYLVDLRGPGGADRSLPGAFPRRADARQWQLTHGQAAVGWMRSSGVAGRMLDDVCQAVETTIKYHVGDSAGGTRAVLEEYPRVLRCCDQLTFDEPAQAAARLRSVGGFDQPLSAGHRAEELAAIGRLTRRLWHQLEALAGDVTPVKDELRQGGAADIFDESVPFSLPSFQVRAYRRGV